MRIRLFIIIFILFSINSCIEHRLSSNEDDDVYFIKKDIVEIEEGDELEIKVE